MDPLSLAMTKTACKALANLMVPKEATWSDRELMLLAYRQAAPAQSETVAPDSGARERQQAAVRSSEIRVPPLAAGKPRRPPGRLLQHRPPQRRLDTRPSASGFPSPSYRRLPVDVHAPLREPRDLLRDLQRRLQRFALWHDPLHQPDALRLVRVDRPPGEDQVQRAPQPDDVRQPLRPAVDQRHAPPPLEAPEVRGLARDADVAPARDLQPAGHAPAVDRCDRRLRRVRARESHRALLRHTGVGSATPVGCSSP